MPKKINQHIADPTERLAIIKDNSYVIEEDQPYFHQFTDEEITDMKTYLSIQAIEMEKLDSEKRTFMDEWKERYKPTKEEFKRLVKGVHSGQEEQRGTLYGHDDQQGGMMIFYNEHGIEVYSRSLRPEELQMSIQSMHKKTN